jgi:hypothetical protein
LLSKPILVVGLSGDHADMEGYLMTTTTCRAVLAGIATTPVPTAPAIAIQPEPIYAALEAVRGEPDKGRSALD